MNLKEERVREDLAHYTNELDRLKDTFESRRAAEAEELERLRRQNESLKELLDAKDQSLHHTVAEAEQATEAAERAAEAVLEAQRQLEKERLEKEKLALLNSQDQAIEQENTYLKMQLKMSHAQIKLLEEKMLPLMEDVQDGRLANESKVRDLLETITKLRDTNMELESQSYQERKEYEAERARIEKEKDIILKTLLEEKLAEKKRLEQQLAYEQQQLQNARVLSMSQGLPGVLKACRSKNSVHEVRLWFSDNTQPKISWTRLGLGGTFTSAKDFMIQDLESITLGQATPVFEKMSSKELKYPEVKTRSISFISGTRSLDLIFPNLNASEVWFQGIRPYLPTTLIIEDKRPNTMKEKLKVKDAKERAERETKLRLQQEKKEEETMTTSTPNEAIIGKEAADAANARKNRQAARASDDRDGVDDDSKYGDVVSSPNPSSDEHKSSTATAASGTSSKADRTVIFQLDASQPSWPADERNNQANQHDNNDATNTTTANNTNDTNNNTLDLSSSTAVDHTDDSNDHTRTTPNNDDTSSHPPPDAAPSSSSSQPSAGLSPVVEEEKANDSNISLSSNEPPALNDRPNDAARSSSSLRDGGDDDDVAGSNPRLTSRDSPVGPHARRPSGPLIPIEDEFATQ